MMNIREEELLRRLNDQKIREYAHAIAFSAIVIFFGVLGNAFSVAFYGFKVPRTTTNVIITVLSTVDLITCIVLSDEIIELCFTLTFKNVGGCKAMYFFNHTFVLTSIFMLLFVAIDRHRRLCFPFRRQISLNAVRVLILLIVTVAIALSVRDWVILDVVRVNVFDTSNGANVTAFYCTHSKADSLQTTIRVFQIIDLLVFVTASGSFIILYSFIAKTLWETRKRLNRYNNRAVISTDIHNNSETCQANNTADNVLKREVDGLHRCYKSHKPTTDSTGDLSDIDLTVVINPPGNTEQGHDKTTTANHPEDKTFPNQQDRVKHSEVTKVDRKVTFMLFVITVAFVISFMPYFIVNVGIKPKSNSSKQEFSAGIQIALRSFMLNNAINPYIIGLFNSKFRTFVMTCLCQLRAICQK